MRSFGQGYREHVRAIAARTPVFVVKDYAISMYGAANAAILALEMLAIDTGPEGDSARKKLAAYRTEMRETAMARRLPIEN